MNKRESRRTRLVVAGVLVAALAFVYLWPAAAAIVVGVAVVAVYLACTLLPLVR